MTSSKPPDDEKELQSKLEALQKLFDEIVRKRLPPDSAEPPKVPIPAAPDDGEA